jgi:hypothetical protein
MNYAWAHPLTGIREQAATQEEARFQVAEELKLEGAPDSLGIFEQEPAGTVESGTARLDAVESWEQYAWASPCDALRRIRSFWKDAVEAIQEEMQRPDCQTANSVIVYRQRFAFSVRREETPPSPKPTNYQETPESLIKQITEGTEPDLSRCSTLALLWIAQALREIIKPNPPAKFPLPIGPTPWDDPPELPAETPEQAEERRARAVRERKPITLTPKELRKWWQDHPHQFSPAAGEGEAAELCALCRSLQTSALHRASFPFPERVCPWCDEGNPRVESSVSRGIFVHTDTSVGRVICRRRVPSTGELPIDPAKGKDEN